MNPSLDYDASTCRYQRGTPEHEALLRAHARRPSLFPSDADLCGLAIAGLQVDATYPGTRADRLYRDGLCVAQWAVIR